MGGKSVAEGVRTRDRPDAMSAARSRHAVGDLMGSPAETATRRGISALRGTPREAEANRANAQEVEVRSPDRRRDRFH